MGLSCVTCTADLDPGQLAWATVPSSERAFEHERFTVWRCPRCRCIHAFEDVDLDRYYVGYGLHETRLDLLERLLYRNKLRFIRRMVDLDRASPVLDFGCGNGIFVDYLRRRGYRDVAGYDPYSPAHADESVLGRPYRLVLSTDVVEHVSSPAEHLTRIPFLNLPTLDDYLERYGGLVALNEPFRWSALRRLGFWYRGLAGGFVSHTDEVQLLFRRAG